MSFSGRRVLSLKSSPSDIQCRSAQCAEAWWLRTSLLAPKTTLANLTASLKPNGFLSNNGENKPEAGDSDNIWKTKTYMDIYIYIALTSPFLTANKLLVFHVCVSAPTCQLEHLPI